MSDFERRKAERRQETFAVSLSVPESVALEGQTLNFSTDGVLLTAHGKIPVLLGIKGKQYRGWLIRAISVDGEMTAYAIELAEALEISAPHLGGHLKPAINGQLKTGHSL